MPVISTPELWADCALIASRARSYSPVIGSLITVMLNTGCREGEVLSRDRWSMPDPYNYYLQPQKGNPPRLISSTVLPEIFRAWLVTSGYPYSLSSVANLRRIVDQFTAYPLAVCGEKRISTHRFRHLRVRQLFDAGQSMDQVKTYMGLVNTSTVIRYRDGVISTP